MKKRNGRKLSLNRETVRSLEEANLRTPLGGASESGCTVCRSDCGSCPASACHPSWCPDTCDCW